MTQSAFIVICACQVWSKFIGQLSRYLANRNLVMYKRTDGMDKRPSENIMLPTSLEGWRHKIKKKTNEQRFQKMWAWENCGHRNAVCWVKAFLYLLHRPGSRHCHLAIGSCTIRQQVFDCKYLSCKMCFNVLNYVFIIFIFNIYCLVNIQQHCHNSRHCDWRHHI